METVVTIAVTAICIFMVVAKIIGAIKSREHLVLVDRMPANVAQARVTLNVLVDTLAIFMLAYVVLWKIEVI